MCYRALSLCSKATFAATAQISLCQTHRRARSLPPSIFPRALTTLFSCLLLPREHFFSSSSPVPSSTGQDYQKTFLSTHWRFLFHTHENKAILFSSSHCQRRAPAPLNCGSNLLLITLFFFFLTLSPILRLCNNCPNDILYINYFPIVASNQSYRFL